MTGRVRAVCNAIVVLQLATTAVVTAPAAAQIDDSRRLCELIAFSPRFETDRTAFCVTNEYAPNSSFPTGNLIVRKSVDGMVSWEQLPAAGLQGLGLAFPSQVVVSPDFPEDNTVYVHVVYGNNPGLYRSADGGSTFTNVAPLVSSGSAYRALSPFLMDEEVVPPPIGGGREAFAYATPSANPALVMPPVHRPVAGAPETTDLFLLSPAFPDAPGIALARGRAPDSPPTAPVPQLSAYRCDATLTCPTKLHAFPPGYVLANAGVTPDGTFYVAVKKLEDQRKFEVWRSTEDGSFVLWSGLNRVLPVVPAKFSVAEPTVSVVGDPAGSGRYYARVIYNPRSDAGGPPADQILESLDGGRTWRRRSFGRTFTQTGRPGTIPWGRRIGPTHAKGDLYMPSSDRLIVIAQSMHADRSTYTGVFCSFDRGRTWNEGCAAPL